MAIREAAFRAQLVDEGDALDGALVRRIAIASIRVERAFRSETAQAAARMRKAPEVFDDKRLVLAQELLGQIEVDSVTIRRRVLAAPEGVDALIDRLQALRVQTDTTRLIAWDQEEGKELDLILGNRPGQTPLSRAGLLTRGIALDHWLGLDPADFAEMDLPTRLNWAVGEVHKIIDMEIKASGQHRARLDTTRRGRAEVAERRLLDLSKDGIALQRSAGAAERSMLKMLRELRLDRAEAKLPAPAPTAVPDPARVVEVAARPIATKPHVQPEFGRELGSFRSEPRPASRGVVESPGANFGVSFAVGQGPDRGGPIRSS